MISLLWLVLGVVSVAPKLLIELGIDLVNSFIPFLRGPIRRIKINVLRIYNLPPHSAFSSQFAKQVLRHQIRMSIETIRELLINGSILVDVESFHRYQEILLSAHETAKLGTNSSGVMIITAHLGSWEMVAKVAASATAMPFYALAKPAKLSALTRMINGLRKGVQVHSIWTDKSSMLKESLSILKSNGFLGFVMDQKPDLRVGTSVEFLSTPTIFVNGPARIALKLRPQVISVFCIRTGPFLYKIFCENISQSLYQYESVDMMTQKMADVISSKIRDYPEQWVWNYKRW